MKFGIISELFASDVRDTEERIDSLMELYETMALSPISFCNCLAEYITDLALANNRCPKCNSELHPRQITQQHDKEDPTKTEKITVNLCWDCGWTDEF